MNRIFRIFDHPLFVSITVLAGLLWLYFSRGINVNHPLYVIIALTLGWIVAFHSSHWHEKNRFIKETRYEAARKLIELSSAVALQATNLNGDIGSLRSKFDLRQGDTGKFFGDWGDIYAKCGEHFNEYQQLHLRFHTAYEENEVLFMEFRPHLSVLTQHWSLLSKAFYDFHAMLHTLTLVHPAVPAEEKYTNKIRLEMEAVSDRCMDVACLYFDMRICLLNATLGKIARQEIPERHPQDPKYQTLNALAKKSKENGPARTVSRFSQLIYRLTNRSSGRGPRSGPRR